jgi:hypothetical protein
MAAPQDFAQIGPRACAGAVDRGYNPRMSNQQFKPPAQDHEIEITFDGKTHKGRYHLEHDNLVVSYQGASKVVLQGPDNDTLARNVLTEIVTAKHGRH